MRLYGIKREYSILYKNELPPALAGGLKYENMKGFSQTLKFWLKPFLNNLFYLQLKLEAIQKKQKSTQRIS
ncbi:hypothetical protein DBB36_07260 [Flavobacterium sp. WLB]|nr:hypothetical protein AKO67_16530 [Flavobacterium sp. VMW]OWU88682.1 hypothetical protein APR43_21430 [Flavobacterium sp. NLM]PUU70722.1 hypothetical protein DBB36_07260 [Flavobacterium sp. WLB]